MKNEITKDVVNAYIIEILTEISLKGEKNTKKSLNTPDLEKENRYTTEENSGMFYKTSVDSLNYKTSETFFTKQFEKELKNILGSSTEFEKLTQYEKQKVQERLDRLSRKEYEWKVFNKKMTSNPSLDEITTYFEEEYEKFAVGLEEFKKPDKDTLKKQRANRKYLPFKLEYFMKHFFKKFQLANNFDTLNGLTKLTSNDYEIIALKYLRTDFMFNDIVSIVLKRAHDNLFNTDSSVPHSPRVPTMYSEDALVVHFYQMRIAYVDILTLTFINAVLNYAVDNNIIKVDIVEISKPFKYFVYYKKSKYAFGQPYGIHEDSAGTILLFFEKCGFFQNKVSQKIKTKGKILDVKKYILPHRLSTEIMKPLKLPYIVTPGKLNMNEIEELVKPILFGDVKLTKSQKLCDSLSYSRKKRFAISESFLELAMVFHEVKPGTFLYEYLKFFPLDIGFPTPLEINQQNSKYMTTQENPSANKCNLKIAGEIKNQILGKTSHTIDKFGQLLNLAQSTTLESSCYLQKKMEKEKLNTLKMDKKTALTSCQIASWLKGYPLYITDLLCARLRMYPREHWVSRTSGQIKHLLCDYTEKKVTLSGLVHMLQAYYKPDKEKTASFNNYLMNVTLSKKTGKKKLFKFFHKNYLDFTNVNGCLYFMNLHIELLKVEKTNKTKVNLEIDQTASGIVFLSLLLRDKKMATVANLINEGKSCPYTYVMNHFEDFAKEHMDEKSEDAIDFLKTDRKLHKYALMCYTYNQTHMGRIEDFYERWRIEKGVFLSKENRDTLFEFARKYEMFIEMIFPGTVKKLEILKEVIDLSVKESNYVQIRTLEGEIINYTFYKYRQRKRARFNPLTKETSSYDARGFDYKVERKNENDLESTEEIQVCGRTHKNKFLSYFIHSVDAAVLRYFIRNMFEQHGTNINHLHDCVIIHPNDVDNFNEIVIDLYKSNELYDMAENMIFNQIRANVSTESQKKLDDLKKEYFLLCDDFKNDMNFKPENIYTYEG